MDLKTMIIIILSIYSFFMTLLALVLIARLGDCINHMRTVYNTLKRIQKGGDSEGHGNR